MFISPQKIRWLFLAKSIIVPPTWLALLIWAMVKVPPSTGLFAQKAGLSGSGLSWAWLAALNSALGNYATLGVSIPDITVGHTYATCTASAHADSEICQDRKRVCERLSRGQTPSTILTTILADNISNSLLSLLHSL